VGAAAMKTLMTMMLALALANSAVGGGDGLPTEGNLSLRPWLVAAAEVPPLCRMLLLLACRRCRCYCCRRCATVVRGRVASQVVNLTAVM